MAPNDQNSTTKPNRIISFVKTRKKLFIIIAAVVCVAVGILILTSAKFSRNSSPKVPQETPQVHGTDPDPNPNDSATIEE